MKREFRFSIPGGKRGSVKADSPMGAARKLIGENAVFAGGKDPYHYVVDDPAHEELKLWEEFKMNPKKRRINVHREQEKAYGRGVNIDIGSHNLPGKGRNAFRSNPVTGLAIETRYVEATNTRGSRMIASTENGHRASMPYNHSLDSAGNHEAVARLLADKQGWSGALVGGATKRGYCWVFEEGTRTFKKNPRNRSLAHREKRLRSMHGPRRERYLRRFPELKSKSPARYHVQYEKREGEWITLGAFPTMEQARDYAKAIHRKHKGRKLRLWWR